MIVSFIVGVSYVLPAEVERLLEAAKKRHSEQELRASLLTKRALVQRQRVTDSKHQQFIDDIMSVSTHFLFTSGWLGGVDL